VFTSLPLPRQKPSSHLIYSSFSPLSSPVKCGLKTRSLFQHLALILAFYVHPPPSAHTFPAWVLYRIVLWCDLAAAGAPPLTLSCRPPPPYRPFLPPLSFFPAARQLLKYSCGVREALHHHHHHHHHILFVNT